MRGIHSLSPSVFEGWNGLIEGALAVHNRFLVLEVSRRLDHGDDAFELRIRPRGAGMTEVPLVPAGEPGRPGGVPVNAARPSVRGPRRPLSRAERQRR
jgi:hypothetical protein